MIWHKTQAELIKEEIEPLLSPLINIAGFQEIIAEALADTGPVTMKDGTRSKPWNLLPLSVCESISGHYEPALPVAAALQLLKAAAEVLDDIEDADSPLSISVRYGNAIATNMATVLIILAEKAIGRLKEREVDDQVIVRVMDTINSYYTITCAGQHLDLSQNPKEEISEEKYLRVSDMKSASTFECACYAGALVATQNQKMLDKAASFGHNLGMMAQIANDIQGINSGKDIQQQKITMPVIFALTQADSETRKEIEKAFFDKPGTQKETDVIRKLLFSSGAIYYTLIKMELYQQRASEILSEMKEMGASVDRLNIFLE
jgi:geranylgeranyl pyrophosphate synthase